MRKLSFTLGQAQSEMNRRIVENIHALRLLHTFDARERAVSQVATAQRTIAHSNLRLIRSQALIAPLSDSLIIVAMGLFLLIGFFWFQRGEGTQLAELIVFITVLNRLAGRVSMMGGNIGDINRRLGLIEVVNDVLRLEGKSFSRRHGAPFARLATGIEFKGVTLRYSGRDVDAIHDLDLWVPRGKVTALVGTSGAGKSSVVDLLLGLYEPSSGAILVDGMDLRSLALSAWLVRVAVVSQDTILFNDSVRENIRFGNPRATRRRSGAPPTLPTQTSLSIDSPQDTTRLSANAVLCYPAANASGLRLRVRFSEIRTF